MSRGSAQNVVSICMLLAGPSQVPRSKAMCLICREICFRSKFINQGEATEPSYLFLVSVISVEFLEEFYI